MPSQFISWVALALVVSLGIVALPTAGTAGANPDELHVPTDYLTIQAAIDDAQDGDTIIVAKGTYTENVLVNKRVTLQSAKKHKAEVVGVWVDQDYNGEADEDAIRITAGGATVEGFHVRIAAAHDGIAVKADGVTVRNNKVTGPGPFTEWVAPTGAGISAILCDDVTIENNDVRYTNGVGIWLTVTNSLIRKNKVEGTQYTGILLAAWIWVSPTAVNHGNLIAGNHVKRAGINGIRLGDGAYNNVVYDNHVHGSGTQGVPDWNNGIKAVDTTYDNTFVGNKIKDSAGFDAYDQSSGTRTANRANWWVGNKFRTSDPPDLE